MMINRYLLLLNITLFLTIISYIIEYFYPIIDNLKNVNYINLFIIRFIHVLIFIYISFYLLLFNYKNNDAIIYLILVIIICALWMIFDCCILSYFELKMYNINYYQYSVNFNPLLISFFRKYQYILSNFFLFMMIFTFFFIIFKNKIIPIIYKSIFSILFIYFIIKDIIPNVIYSFYNNTDYKYINNQNILILENIFSI